MKGSEPPYSSVYTSLLNMLTQKQNLMSLCLEIFCPKVWDPGPAR